MSVREVVLWAIKNVIELKMEAGIILDNGSQGRLPEDGIEKFCEEA